MAAKSEAQAEFDKCARPSGTWAGFDQVDATPLRRPAALTLRARPQRYIMNGR